MKEEGNIYFRVVTGEGGMKGFCVVVKSYEPNLTHKCFKYESPVHLVFSCSDKGHRNSTSNIIALKWILSKLF